MDICVTYLIEWTSFSPWNPVKTPIKTQWSAMKTQWKHYENTMKPYGYGSIPINTIFSGMNIHLPAILGFTRYQCFDPSPYETLTNYPKKTTGSNPGHSFVRPHLLRRAPATAPRPWRPWPRDANEVGTEAKTPSGKRLQRTMVGKVSRSIFNR